MEAAGATPRHFLFLSKSTSIMASTSPSSMAKRNGDIDSDSTASPSLYDISLSSMDLNRSVEQICQFTSKEEQLSPLKQSQPQAPMQPQISMQPQVSMQPQAPTQRRQSRYQSLVALSEASAHGEDSQGAAMLFQQRAGAPLFTLDLLVAPGGMEGADLHRWLHQRPRANTLQPAGWNSSSSIGLTQACAPAHSSRFPEIASTLNLPIPAAELHQALLNKASPVGAYPPASAHQHSLLDLALVADHSLVSSRYPTPSTGTASTSSSPQRPSSISSSLSPPFGSPRRSVGSLQSDITTASACSSGTLSKVGLMQRPQPAVIKDNLMLGTTTFGETIKRASPRDSVLVADSLPPLTLPPTVEARGGEVPGVDLTRHRTIASPVFSLKKDTFCPPLPPPKLAAAPSTALTRMRSYSDPSFVPCGAAASSHTNEMSRRSTSVVTRPHRAFTVPPMSIQRARIRSTVPFPAYPNVATLGRTPSAPLTRIPEAIHFSRQSNDLSTETTDEQQQVSNPAENLRQGANDAPVKNKVRQIVTPGPASCAQVTRIRSGRFSPGSFSRRRCKSDFAGSYDAAVAKAYDMPPSASFALMLRSTSSLNDLDGHGEVLRSQAWVSPLFSPRRHDLRLTRDSHNSSPQSAINSLVTVIEHLSSTRTLINLASKQVMSYLWLAEDAVLEEHLLDRLGADARHAASPALDALIHAITDEARLVSEASLSPFVAETKRLLSKHAGLPGDDELPLLSQLNDAVKQGAWERFAFKLLKRGRPKSKSALTGQNAVGTADLLAIIVARIKSPSKLGGSIPAQDIATVLQHFISLLTLGHVADSFKPRLCDRNILRALESCKSLRLDLECASQIDTTLRAYRLVRASSATQLNLAGAICSLE